MKKIVLFGVLSLCGSVAAAETTTATAMDCEAQVVPEREGGHRSRRVPGNVAVNAFYANNFNSSDSDDDIPVVPSGNALGIESSNYAQRAGQYYQDDSQDVMAGKMLSLLFGIQERVDNLNNKLDALQFKVAEIEKKASKTNVILGILARKQGLNLPELDATLET